MSQAYKYSPNQDSSQFKSAVYEVDGPGGPGGWGYPPDWQEGNPPIYANAAQIEHEEMVGAAIEDRAQQLYNAA